jgi:hypothetical protein
LEVVAAQATGHPKFLYLLRYRHTDIETPATRRPAIKNHFRPRWKWAFPWIWKWKYQQNQWLGISISGVSRQIGNA